MCFNLNDELISDLIQNDMSKATEELNRLHIVITMKDKYFTCTFPNEGFHLLFGCLASSKQGSIALERKGELNAEEER